ncbi:thiol peroxidase [Corynebacterium sp. MNWGS58]|uniref:thiol peroxidase n=1 Tax=Corynebacterium sp. 102791.4 TaxID=3104612 RepID=UPI0035163B98
MATTKFQGQDTNTVGELPQVGDKLPDFTVVGSDLQEFSPSDYAGKKLVLNIFPSVDTGVCATSVRRFNEEATALDNTVVLGISADLPMAQGRFTDAEGIENVKTGSVFRSNFGQEFGLQLDGSPLKGLLARTVIVTDENHEITHVELVDEITSEPNYDAALEALQK